MGAMNWPGHDDAPNFEIGRMFSFRWLRAARARISSFLSRRVIFRLAQGLIALFVITLLACLVIFQPDVKASLLKTLDRMGRSAEAQGKLLPDTMPPTAIKIPERKAE
jgi:hypothetical protein